MQTLMKNASRTSVAGRKCSRATFQLRSRHGLTLCDGIRLLEIEREAWGQTGSSCKGRQSTTSLCRGMGWKMEMVDFRRERVAEWTPCK